MRTVVFTLWFTGQLLAGALLAQEVDPRPRTPLDPSVLQAVRAVFAYDQSIPLAAVVLEQTEDELSVREKIVFTGIRGDRVPGYLAVPKDGRAPYPVVLLLHAGTFSKEAWWTEEIYGGRALTEDLLRAGIAVAALDAQYHGERSANIDYLPISEMYFERKWFHRYREVLMESIGDYRRALDYLEEDERLDLTRVGAVGHSTGGIIGLGLAAVDDRVTVAAAGVAAISDPWLYPVTPTNLAPAIGAATLLLVGRADHMITQADSERLFVSLSEPKHMVTYDSGHLLPPESNEEAARWLRRFLLN